MFAQLQRLGIKNEPTALVLIDKCTLADLLACTCYTVEYDPFIKSQLASHKSLEGDMWCIFFTRWSCSLQYRGEQNSHTPPCGESPRDTSLLFSPEVFVRVFARVELGPKPTP